MTKIFSANNFRSAFKNKIGEGCASDEVAALP
jgi:hypothetical protein